MTQADETFQSEKTSLEVPQRGIRPFGRQPAAFLISSFIAAAAGVTVIATGVLQEKAAPVRQAEAVVIPAVVGLGYLEPSSTIVRIAAPGGGESSRIGDLKVAEGDEVNAGQVLAVLDTAEKLKAQLEAAEATVLYKRLALEKQEVEIDYTIQSRREAFERARADLESAKAEYERQVTLVSQNAATVSNLEKKKKDYRTAEASLREAEAALRRIEARSKIKFRSAAGMLIDAAVAEQDLVSAEADLKVARANYDQTLIRAPFSGRVLSLKARAGERIGAEGLLELGATSTMRAVIEVYQSDIGRVRVAQKVNIKAEALSGAIEGQVERIGNAVKRQTVVNNDPATATDNRVVEVFVALDAETGRRVSGLSRLQVHGVFGE